ncbi:MAG: GNAT family N-acetyltransferase [Pseudomonadota bacterium]
MSAGTGGAAVSVRDATPADIAVIQAIYAHFVLHGPASFEEVPPDALEVARRRDAVLALGLPYLVAVIGDSANEPSIALHRALGFETAGVLRAVGFKFGRWIDSVLMQRPLGPGDRSLP